MPEAEGERFGRYRLIEVLSRGSLGTIYRAFDPILHREVAIKVLSQARMAEEEEVARFMREARAVARLSHPNVVPVHEVGGHDDMPYFTMDFVHGRSLSEIIKSDGPMTPRRAVQICRDVAEAIRAAHARGIIHRDLKPSNVMLTDDGRVLVMDFGLAKVLEEDTLKTRTGTAIGTPAYMPPEQARGEASEVGPASDVYSLGAVLYECVTGRPPFEGQGVVDIVLQVMDYPPRTPRKLNPRIPRDLEAVILKCLEKNPAYRYGDMDDLSKDLGRFLEGEAVEARSPGLWRRTGAFLYRHRGALSGAVVGAAVVAVLVVLATMFLGRRSREGSSTLAFSAGFESVKPPDPEHFNSRAPLVDYRDGVFKVDVESKEYITTELFYGNYRADLTFTAAGDGPAGFRIRGQEKVSLLAKHDGSHLVLVGQDNLENYSQRSPFAGMKPLAGVNAPPLREGARYRMCLQRNNLDITLLLFAVGGEPGGETAAEPAGRPGEEEALPLASLHYRGLQLTNWHLKNVNIGVIGIGGGVEKGLLKVWLEVPSSHTADDRFYRGDYNGAISAYKGMLEDRTLPPSMRALCLLHLAYIDEIKFDFEDAEKRLASLMSLPGVVEEDILVDARVRRFMVAVRDSRFDDAALLLDEAFGDWARSPWRYETLTAADICNREGAYVLGGRLLKAVAGVFPGEVADSVLSANCRRMLAAEEFASFLDILRSASFPSRQRLTEELLESAVKKGLPIPAREGAALLALGAKKGGECTEFLAEVVERGLVVDSPAAPAVLEGAGHLCPGIVAELIASAASTGRLRLLGRALALYPQAKFSGPESTRLLVTARRLLEDGHFSDVMRLYESTQVPLLREPAVSAAARLSSKKPEQVLRFLLKAAAVSPVEEDMMETAEGAALALAAEAPMSIVLRQWFASPLCRRDSAAKVLDPLLKALWASGPSGSAAFIGDIIESSPLPGVLSELPVALYKTITGTLGAGKAAGTAFRVLRHRLDEGRDLHFQAQYVLADVYAVMGHPEAAVVIWDALAFDPGRAEPEVVSGAALRAGVYFVLSGQMGRGRDYLTLAELPAAAPEWVSEIADLAGREEGARMVAGRLRSHRNFYPAAVCALGDFFDPLYTGRPDSAKSSSDAPSDGASETPPKGENAEEAGKKTTEGPAEAVSEETTEEASEGVGDGRSEEEDKGGPG